MHPVRSTLKVAAALIATLAVLPVTETPAWSQEAPAAQPILLARGPRFLVVAKKGAEPQPIDIERMPLLHERISLDLETVSLDEALATIARKAGIHLVYSGVALDLNKPVSFRTDRVSVAAALTEVLLDVKVDVLFAPSGREAVLVRRGAPAVGTISGRVTDAKNQAVLVGATVVVDGISKSTTTGSDGRYRIAAVAPGTYTVRARYIGYAPATASVMVSAGQEATADFALEKSAQRLDEVVTTGTVIPTELKALPTPISVVTGDEIEQRGYQRLDQIFRGDIPGALAWDNGAGGAFYADLNVRGASSLFTGDNVKTYIDGVEVANQTFLATIDPSTIERIEVLRGPQATTIYGSQALSGVMQIFTKKGDLVRPGPRFEAKASAGIIESPWDNTAQTDNSLAIAGGGPAFSYRLAGGYSRHGEWVPGFHQENASVDGGAHGVQGPVTIDLSARYYDRNYGAALDPRLQAAGYVNWSKPFDETGIVRQQTYGLTLTYAATPRWSHKVTLGYDRTGYEDYQNRPRFTTPADSLFHVSNYDYNKASIAYSTTYSLRLGRAVQSALTAGADHWTFQQGGFFAAATTSSSNSIPAPNSGLRYEYHNSGFFAQEQLGFRDAVFLTAGLRAEDNQNFGTAYGLSWAPRVGASFVHSVGTVTGKARIAWGRATRPPFAGAAQGSVASYAIQLANPKLGPEQQAGPDAGLEIYFGNRGSVEATYYHQTAIDLIDYVLVDGNTVPQTFQYQNVGQVKNTGWEFQGRLNAGRLSLVGTYSITTSKVEQLSPTYGGDLLPGDALLHIPQHTGGATLAYSLPRTAIQFGVTYIGSWTDYDELALYGAFYGGQPFRNSLRDYWIRYPGFAKLHLTLSQAVTNSFSVFLQADNLTNNHASERNNLNLTSGRSTLLGVRTRL